MSVGIPPTLFFPGINFNPSFYSIGEQAVTFQYIDSHYLRSTDYAISRAIYTQFYGTVYCLNGISGDGTQLSNLNVSNATSGTLTISRGGIGTTSLNSNQILVGNAATSIIQSANLTWDNTTNTLSASNFVGSGSNISNLDYNNITYNKPNLTIYALQTYVDGSLNTVNATLNTKQNIISVSTPLIKDISNNISIDLSAYPLKNYVDGSLNTINANKQNNLTFSNPFLNTWNTISLKYNSTLFNIDSSGNLSLVTSYLPLSGGTMSGQITGVTTLNGTTGIFGTVSTTNNTNQAIPSIGNFGGTGDKLILYPGTATTYPSSLGIESNALWVSSPNSIKLYNNGTNSFLIDSSGNVTVNGKTTFNNSSTNFGIIHLEHILLITVSHPISH